MNLGPLGILGSLAGTQRALARGAEGDRQQQATAASRGAERSAEQSNKAESLGAADENSQSEDRDADGRRAWERAFSGPAEEESRESSAGVDARPSDPSGRKGRLLDLLG